jgi:type VI protein secretion system component VasA
MSPNPFRLPPLSTYKEQSRQHLEASLADFARSHPIEAKQAGVRAGGVYDPHIDLLLSCVADRHAHNERQIDLGWLQAQREIVERLDPLLGLQLPSCLVVQLGASVGDPPGVVVKRDAALRPAKGVTGLVGAQSSIVFHTTQDVELWPVKVEKAWMSGSDAAFALRLKLVSQGKPFDELHGLDRLSFYLHGAREVTFPLYEALLTAEEVVAVSSGRESALQVAPQGFDDAERLLPEAAGILAGRRLFVELALMPEKFLFVQLADLSLARPGTGNELEIVFRLRGAWGALKDHVNDDVFRLGCTPARNLKVERGVAVTCPPNHFEHLVNPNSALLGPPVMEVVQVLGVRPNTTPGAADIPPLFGARHDYTSATPDLFYATSRRRADGDGPAAEQVSVRLLDGAGRTADPMNLAVDVLVCHGDLAVERPIAWVCGGLRTTVLAGPTVSLRPRAAAGATNGLIPGLGQIGLPNLGSGAEDGQHLHQRLQAVLALAPWLPAQEMQPVNANQRKWLGDACCGLLSAAFVPDGALLERDPAAYIPGRACVIRVVPQRFPGGSVFLVGNVLECLVSQTAGTNTFTRLIVETPGERLIWKARPLGDAASRPQLETREKQP